jgi:hypothetical protein
VEAHARGHPVLGLGELTPQRREALVGAQGRGRLPATSKNRASARRAALPRRGRGGRPRAGRRRPGPPGRVQDLRLGSRCARAPAPGRGRRSCRLRSSASTSPPRLATRSRERASASYQVAVHTPAIRTAARTATTARWIPSAPRRTSSSLGRFRGRVRQAEIGQANAARYSGPAPAPLPRPVSVHDHGHPHDVRAGLAQRLDRGQDEPPWWRCLDGDHPTACGRPGPRSGAAGRAPCPLAHHERVERVPEPRRRAACGGHRSAPMVSRRRPRVHVGDQVEEHPPDRGRAVRVQGDLRRST